MSLKEDDATILYICNLNEINLYMQE